MLPPEADLILDYVGDLWPKWTPTTAELALWKKTILPWPPDLARQSIEHHKSHQKFRPAEPNLGDVQAAYVELGSQRPVSCGESEHNGYSGIWAVCVAGPQAGRFVGHAYNPAQPLPIGHVCQDNAEALRRALAENHGGEWQLWGEPTHPMTPGLVWHWLREYKIVKRTPEAAKWAKDLVGRALATANLPEPATAEASLVSPRDSAECNSPVPVRRCVPSAGQ